MLLLSLFFCPRQWKLFSSCLLVKRPHEEHVCLYSSDCKGLPVSIVVTDRFSHSHCNCGHFHTFSLDKNSNHSLFQFCIDVDPAFFRASPAPVLCIWLSRPAPAGSVGIHDEVQLFPSKLKSRWRLGHTVWQPLIQTSASKQYRACKWKIYPAYTQ